MEKSLTKLFKPKLRRFLGETPSQSALSAGPVSEYRKSQALIDYSDFITMKAGGPTPSGGVRKCAYWLGEAVSHSGLDSNRDSQQFWGVSSS